MAAKMLLKMLSFVLVCLGIYYGCRYVQGARNAVIRNMTPSGMEESAKCWVELEFKRIPSGINPLDIKLVFSGDILANGSITYDWSYITAHAHVRRKTGWGRDKATNVFPDKPPPLKMPFEVCFPLNAKHSLTTDHSFDVTAILLWGGKKQDAAIGSFRYQYHIKR